MGFYNSPADMFASRANRFQREGDRHWALAKNGNDAYHYGKAKFCYSQSSANRVKSEQATAAGRTFEKRK